MSDEKQMSFEGMLDGTEKIKQDEESRALVPFSAGQFSTDMPDLSMDDLVIPRLRLAQGLTPEVQSGAAKPGMWLLTGFPPQETVEFIPVMFGRSRRLRTEEGETLCESPDAKVGVGDPGGTCASCPKSHWSGSGDNRRPPECDFAYSYIGYSVTHGSAVIVEFRRTGATAGRVMNTMILNAGGLSKLSAILSSRHEQKGRRTYHVPVVSQSGRSKKSVIELLQKFSLAAGGAPEGAAPEDAAPWDEGASGPVEM